VLALGTNLPAYVLASLSLDAAGIDSLAVSAGTAAPPVWTLFTPAITPTQMRSNGTGRWRHFGIGTQRARPWTTVPGQIENSAILGSPLTNGQPAQFFRVRSD